MKPRQSRCALATGLLSALLSAAVALAGEPPNGCDDDYCFKDRPIDPRICVCVTPAGHVDISGGPGGWTIVARVDSGVAPPTVSVSYWSPGQIITQITVNGGTGAGAYVPLLTFSNGPPTIGHVRKILKGSGIAGLDIGGVISGDLGPSSVGSATAVEATAIGNFGSLPPGLVVSGSVTGDIILANVSPSGDNPQVSILDVGNGLTPGHLLASIEARGGAIDQIMVAGTIGDEEHLPHIAARLDIGQILASSIRADIIAGQEAGYGEEVANIGSIITNAEASGSSGDFVGAVVVNTIGSGLNGKTLSISENALKQLYVKGNLGDGETDTSLQFDAPISNPTFSASPVPVIFIGGSLFDNPSSGVYEINLPADGLEGHVAINGGDESGEWEEGAVVRVGSVELTEPAYSTLPDEVGGGSVGVAPFGLYRTGCEPRASSVTPLHISTTCTLEDPSCIEALSCVTNPHHEMVLRFTGPLVQEEEAFATGKLVIKRRSISSVPLAWDHPSIVDIASQFKMTYEIENNVGSVIRVRRDDNANLGAQFEYRITPGASPPVCAGVLGSPEVAAFTYQVSFYFDCSEGLVELFDLNEDGVVDYADLLQWLIVQQDLNYDGAANDVDFQVLYAAIQYYNSLP